jgi:hypothetical protein
MRMFERGGAFGPEQIPSWFVAGSAGYKAAQNYMQAGMSQQDAIVQGVITGLRWRYWYKIGTLSFFMAMCIHLFIGNAWSAPWVLFSLAVAAVIEGIIYVKLVDASLFHRRALYHLFQPLERKVAASTPMGLYFVIFMPIILQVAMRRPG